MAVRYKLLSGGHADKDAKLVDRQTGKLQDMPAEGAGPGDIIEYAEDPGFDKSDPKRFVKLTGEEATPEVKSKGKKKAVEAEETPVEKPETVEEPVPEELPLDEKVAEKTVEEPDTSLETEESLADEDGEVDLSKMTVAQLQAYAEENEIDLAGAKLKEDIVKTIQAARDLMG